MTRDRDPLRGIGLLLVDGNNLLHALRRRRAAGAGGAAGAEPPEGGAALVGRLRAAIPPAVRVEIVFDGPAERGAARRVAAGVDVTYAGRRAADAVIEQRTELAERPGSILVVSDDAELRRRVRAGGAATARSAWLLGRLARPRLAAPAVARPAPVPPGQDDAAERPGWQPGRGATRKVGNPRRAPRRPRRAL